MNQELIRYSVIDGKYPRELLLLRTTGCFWSKCSFCDYHEDKNPNTYSNILLNKEVLSKVRGKEIALDTLQVICSASFAELPIDTLLDIITTALEKGIKTIIFEGHWIYRKTIATIRNLFDKYHLNTMYIIGVETFNIEKRELIFNKGMGKVTAPQISEYFQWANLMFGMIGQTIDELIEDVELGLTFMKRLNICMFVPNSTNTIRDDKLIQAFYLSSFYQKIKDNPNIEILDELKEDAIDHLNHIGGTQNVTKSF